METEDGNGQHRGGIPALEARGVSHNYGAVQALSNVDLSIPVGEVVGLVGANGAGKSTLVRVLTGVLSPKAGALRINGQAASLHNVRDAADAGIGVVHQHLDLVPDLTVAQNLFLAEEHRFSEWGTVSPRRVNEAAGPLLDRVGLGVSPAAIVSQLSIGDRQLVAAARALRDAQRTLILDEPTSSLSPSETRQLMTTVRAIAESGVGVLYISHRLDEVAELCDAVTVLRDGRAVASFRDIKARLDEVVNAMVPGFREAAKFDRSRATGPVVLDVDSVKVGKHGPASFQLHEGEVLGLFGLIGAGRSMIAKAITGLTPRNQGVITLRGHRVELNSPYAGYRSGIAYLSEDRQGESILPGLSVLQNIAIRASGQARAGGRLRRAWIRDRVTELIDQLDIKTPSPDSPIQALSGGNQQKAVLARLLIEELAVMVLDEPTHGIDVGAKRDLVRVLHRLADGGKGIIYISSEWSELVSTVDRVLIVRNGRVVAELDPDTATEEQAMAAAAGTTATPPRHATNVLKQMRTEHS